MNTRILTLSLSLFGLAATAEPPAAPRPAREPTPRTETNRRPPVIERWLNHLETADPEEHRRLTALREEDPAAFRDAVREALAAARDHHAGRRPGRGAPLDFAQERQALREARTEAERETARSALREAVARHVDQRLDMREQRIQNIRDELERLETRHREDQDRRDAWIETVMERLLND